MLLALVAIVGLAMGSAVTALAHRVPRGVSWAQGRSACPMCGHPLGVLDLIPLLSFVASRGRCRHCGARIAWRYPLTELACGTLLILGRSVRWATIPLATIVIVGVGLIHVHLDWFVGEHGTGGMAYSVALLVLLLLIAARDRDYADVDVERLEELRGL